MSNQSRQRKKQKVRYLLDMFKQADTLKLGRNLYVQQRNVNYSEVTDDPDNEVLYMEWASGGQVFNRKFTERALGNAPRLPDGRISLTDHEGERVVIALLHTKQIDLWKGMFGNG